TSACWTARSMIFSTLFRRLAMVGASMTLTALSHGATRCIAASPLGALKCETSLYLLAPAGGSRVPLPRPGRRLVPLERHHGGELRRELRGEARGQVVVVAVDQEVAHHDRALAPLGVADPRDRIDHLGAGL